MACNIRGHPLYSTSAILSGVGQPRTSLSGCRWENIWLFQCTLLPAVADKRMGMELTTGSFLWGGVLMCHAACKNFGGLMAARFFLGVGEAAIAPGFALLTGMFYKREEQPLR